jgi:hypothetical protein
MSVPPPADPRPPLPDDPTIQVASSHQEATVHDIDVPPGEPSGPPRTPLVLFAILIALIVLAATFWFVRSQQSTQAAADATATAVTQATATAASVAQQNAATTQTATAQQGAAAASTQQAAVASQATTTAQQAAVAVSTATAQTAAAAQAGATAQAVSAQATAAADAAKSVPTATPVVVVVTATAVPAPAAPPPPSLPSSGQVAPTPAPPPQIAAPAPPGGQPAVPPPPAPQPARPNASPAASPATGQSPADTTVVQVTTAPGRPTQLRCLGERVTVMANADALPPQLTLTCGPVDAGSVPPSPSSVVGGTLFRLGINPSDGNNLKGTVDLRLTYPGEAVPSADRGRVALGYLDGSNWTILPDQTSEPATTSVSAKTDRAGVYALYLKP